MDKRKEITFNPEEQIDFTKLVETLDWTKEINPVMLVKTVNSVAGLKGAKQYKTNEVSFGLLLKSFEKRVRDFVDIRFAGKDRFYTKKPDVTVEEIVYYAKTGKKMEPKPEVPKKKDYEKYYIPEEVQPEETGTSIKVKKKKSFPDDEALLKTYYLLGALKEHSGKCEAKLIMDIKKKNGWKNQRACGGTQYTIYQEANAVCTQFLDMKDPIEVILKKTVTFKGDLGILDSKISDVFSLIENPDLKKKVEAEKPKEEPKPKPEEPKEKEPRIVLGKSQLDLPKPKGRVIVTSPVVGKNTYTKIDTPTSYYENTKTRWSKALLAEEIYRAGQTKRGTYFSYIDIQNGIKRHRFTELGIAELKQLITEIGEKQFRGIWKIEREGIIIGSEVMLGDLYFKYEASKITETIFIRLHMTLSEIQSRFPDLQVKVASEISEADNIYSIEANRSEACERALAKLFWCMRDGEKILESPNNWTIKRIETVQEKLGLTRVY